jgi:ribose transport system permease protein
MINGKTDTIAKAEDGGPGQRFRLKSISWATLGMDRFSLLYVWAIIIVVFIFWDPSTFPTHNTFLAISGDYAVTALVALALLPGMAAGVFDLSVGAMMGFAIVFMAWCESRLGWDVGLSLLATVLSAIVVGTVNAIVVTRFRVSSFIATLGMQSILLALMFWLSGDEEIATGISGNLTDFGRSTGLYLPTPTVCMLVVAVLMWYVLERTPLGRRTYATGGNEMAARLTGIRTTRLKFGSLIVSAVIASLAGVLFLSIIGAASLDAGSPYLLPGFAAVFLGATQVKRGRANVVGTIIAVYVLATGVQGLQLVGGPFWVSYLFNGLALIIAVALAQMNQRHLSSPDISF